MLARVLAAFREHQWNRSGQALTEDRHYARNFKILLAASLVLRLIIAFYLPLGVDESYAIAVAREFSLAFYDHPPLGFWSPILAGHIFGFDHPMVYRLPFLIYGMATMMLIYNAGKALVSRRAGIWAAAFYGLSPFFVVAGGILVVPDGPLNLAMALSAYLMIRILKDPEQPQWGRWALLGLGIAIALASKYQAVFLPFAGLIYAVFTRTGRTLLMRPGIYLAMAIGACGILPVLIWNLQHDWISLSFQSQRAGHNWNPANLILMLGLQSLYLLPPTVIIAVRALGATARQPFDNRKILTALAALGPILAFNVIYAFSDNTLPHWTMPGWLVSLPLAGAWFVVQPEANQRAARYWLYSVGGFIWILLFAALLHVNTGILTRTWNEIPPEWDDTVEAFDWRPVYDALGKRGLLTGLDVVVADDWIDGGLNAVAVHAAYPIRIIGPDMHHFQFMQGQKATGNALMMQLRRLDPQSNDRDADAMLQLARTIDPAAQILPPIILERGGQAYAAALLVHFKIAQ
jgi:Dolichyl-phosphate-mannose-protein mannosyltransferase